MTWDVNVNAISDPIADLKAWQKAIAEQTGLRPHRHEFFGMEHLRRFFRGEAICGCGCFMRLDPESDKYVTCHPDDFDGAMKLAWENQCVIKPHSFVPQGTIYLVRMPSP